MTGKVKEMWQEQLDNVMEHYIMDGDEDHLKRELRGLGFNGTRLREQMEFAQEARIARVNEELEHFMEGLKGIDKEKEG